VVWDECQIAYPKMVGNQSDTWNSPVYACPRRSAAKPSLYTNASTRVPPSKRVLLPPRKGVLRPPEVGQPPLSEAKMKVVRSAWGVWGGRRERGG